MEKQIYDEKNGLWYELQGDYYIPCLTLPTQEDKPIGIWGQRHLRYIKQNKRGLYSSLLASGKLNGYLVDIDKQAEEMFSQLVKQLAEKENVTEKLKAENQMEWVGRINSIRNRATEVVNSHFVFI
ncbi:MAG: TnpV protein [Clostridiales bacterium GWF2_38_85]|nr:MAG: TnpV protein [Clostridiales bacterium GWF2_38_85]HBL84869.1 TnpV protein [Clostridiales bacterium]